MAKKKKQPTKTCADCIHEYACRMWTNGRSVSDESATRCPNHQTVKESGAYLCGVLDERRQNKNCTDDNSATIENKVAEFIHIFERTFKESLKDEDFIRELIKYVKPIQTERSK